MGRDYRHPPKHLAIEKGESTPWRATHRPDEQPGAGRPTQIKPNYARNKQIMTSISSVCYEERSSADQRVRQLLEIWRDNSADFDIISLSHLLSTLQHRTHSVEHWPDPASRPARDEIARIARVSRRLLTDAKLGDCLKVAKSLVVLSVHDGSFVLSVLQKGCAIPEARLTANNVSDMVKIAWDGVRAKDEFSPTIAEFAVGLLEKGAKFLLSQADVLAQVEQNPQAGEDRLVLTTRMLHLLAAVKPERPLVKRIVDGTHNVLQNLVVDKVRFGLLLDHHDSVPYSLASALRNLFEIPDLVDIAGNKHYAEMISLLVSKIGDHLNDPPLLDPAWDRRATAAYLDTLVGSSMKQERLALRLLDRLLGGQIIKHADVRCALNYASYFGVKHPKLSPDLVHRQSRLLQSIEEPIIDFAAAQTLKQLSVLGYGKQVVSILNSIKPNQVRSAESFVSALLARAYIFSDHPVPEWLSDLASAHDDAFGHDRKKCPALNTCEQDLLVAFWAGHTGTNTTTSAPSVRLGYRVAITGLVTIADKRYEVALEHIGAAGHHENCDFGEPELYHRQMRRRALSQRGITLVSIPSGVWSKIRPEAKPGYVIEIVKNSIGRRP